jgi:hypothetical protein
MKFAANGILKIKLGLHFGLLPKLRLTECAESWAFNTRHLPAVEFMLGFTNERVIRCH